MVTQYGLVEQYGELHDPILEAISNVIYSERHILGPHVDKFENAFAEYCQVDYAVGCASGTDAITLALMALKISTGDEVITVANTAVPTILGIIRSGATPVFVDVGDDYLIDPSKIESVITERTRAILPVHLYGAVADMRTLSAIADKYGLYLIEDAAQAHGACLGEQRAGHLSDIGCFSFYPTKNLGCIGDGGILTTNSQPLYESLLELRNCGQRSRYVHSRIGLNSRLDEIQAAILNVKLPFLDQWNSRRRDIAQRYTSNLSEFVVCPTTPHDCTHVFHQYVIRSPQRDGLLEHMKTCGVPLLIHYPIPCHLQEACHHLGWRQSSLPRTERHSTEVISLPMHPYLTDAYVDELSDKVIDYEMRTRRP